MKRVEFLQAEDGSLWSTVEEAARRDELCLRVRRILSRVPMPPDSMFERVAVAGAEVRWVKAGLVALARETYPTEAVFQQPPERIDVFGWAGRLLSEQGGPIDLGWRWLACVGAPDETDRCYVYQQPFFALNPDRWGAT